MAVWDGRLKPSVAISTRPHMLEWLTFSRLVEIVGLCGWRFSTGSSISVPFFFLPIFFLGKQKENGLHTIELSPIPLFN
jgi:hypothetical protein